MKFFCFTATILVALCCSSCGGETHTAARANASSQTTPARVEPSPMPTPQFPEPFSFEGSEGVFRVKNFSFDADNKTFSFGGFVFATRDRKEKLKDDETEYERSDIVITKNGKVVRRFAGMMYPLGVATRFGTFSFLGDRTQQVVIEQTINRNEYYRVLDLAGGELRVIYEGGSYISAADFDGDGALEIVTRIETFRFFYHLTNVDSPFPTAIYKYNSRVKKYALANRRFTAYVLRDLDKEMRAVEAARPTDEEAKQSALRGSGTIPDHRFPAYLSAVITVMADLIYAGEETRAWEFFEREYNLSDKDTLRQKIKEQLADDKIHRTLYRR